MVRLQHWVNSPEPQGLQRPLELQPQQHHRRRRPVRALKQVPQDHAAAVVAAHCEQEVSEQRRGLVVVVAWAQPKLPICVEVLGAVN